MLLFLEEAISTNQQNLPLYRDYEACFLSSRCFADLARKKTQIFAKLLCE